MKLVGGQAVIEGVMMRCGSKLATAVRKEGKILVKKEKFQPYSERHRLLGIPVIRGFVNLIDFMVIGVRTLEYSAQQAAGEHEEVSKPMLALIVALSLAAGLFLFVFLPYLITYGIGIKEQESPILFNIIDGIVKLGVLLAYVASIGRMQDVRRLFQYHGAEHKAVACHEHKKELTVKNCRKYGTRHTRCGTSLLLLVILVGVLVFSFVPVIVFRNWPAVAGLPFLLKYPLLFAARLLVLPLVAGLAYEIVKQSHKMEHSLFFQVLLWPGMAVQRLTTKEPEDDQVEVAIAALKAVV